MENERLTFEQVCEHYEFANWELATLVGQGEINVPSLKHIAPVTDQLRPLTTYQRSLIQTFPPDFIWTGTKTNRERMIGNAVPVNLATYVANAIVTYTQVAWSKLKRDVPLTQLILL